MKIAVSGSIETKIDKHGQKTYAVRYRWLDLATGKRRQSTKRGFKRKGDAQKFLEEIKTKLQSGQSIPNSKLTLAQVADEWLASEVEGKLRPNTINWYKVNKDNHIKPYIGMLKMEDITPTVLQELYRAKSAEGLSDTSVYYIHRTMKQICKYAVRKHYITEDITQSIEIKLRRSSNKKPNILTPEEIHNLIQRSEQPPYADIALAIALAGFMGLRRGEILGLKYSAIDRKNRILHISEQKTGYDEEDSTSELKTESSCRNLPIPDIVWEYLCQQEERTAKLAEKYGCRYDFTTGFVCCYFSEKNFGHPFKPNYFSRKFGELVKENEKTTGFRFHDLRHSYASWLIHQKIPVTTVAMLLGHASPDITMKTYAHILKQAYLKECEEINDYLNMAVGLDRQNEKALGNNPKPF